MEKKKSMSFLCFQQSLQFPLSVWCLHMDAVGVENDRCTNHIWISLDMFRNDLNEN